MTEKRFYPKVPAYVEGRQLVLWCCWCSKWHRHGYDGTDSSYGHRVAHCHVETSPYRVAGYVLVKAATIDRKRRS